MIIVSKNIINEKSVETQEYEGLLSDFIMDNFQDELLYGYDLKVVINGGSVPYTNLDAIIEKDDEVNIMINPAVTALVGFLINMAISFAVAYILKKLSETDTDSIDDKGGKLYNVAITAMEMRKDAALKELFGTNITFPDLIAPTYTRYEDNKEVTYLTTCVGIGEYTFDKMYMNKEEASNILLTGNNYDCEGVVNGGGSLANQTPCSESENTDLVSTECDGYAKNGVIDCLNNKQNYLNIIKLDGHVSSFNNFSDSRFSTYRYLVNELVDFKNYNIIDFDKDNTGKLTKGSRLDYMHDIDSFEVDIATNDGIYSLDDDGNAESTTISFKMICYQLGSNGEETNQKEFIFSKTLETGKKNRWTYKYNLPVGQGWYIKLRNNTAKTETGSSVVNGFTITRIKGLSTYTVVNTTGITYAIFKIKTGDVFDQYTNLKLSLKVSRKGLVKMNDVVNYIWAQSGYNFLELSRTNELLSKYEVHGGMDAKLPLFEQINRVLRAQELYIIPTISGFDVREDLYRIHLTTAFDKSSIIADSVETSLVNHNKLINDGYKAVYIDYDGEKQEVIYPENAYNPKEMVVFGVRDRHIAEARARVGYKRMTGQNKTIKFKTDLKGYIPNLGDKIAVAEFYIDQNEVVKQIGYNGNVIMLDKEILLTGDEYVSIKSETQDVETRRKLVPYVGYTKDIEIEGYTPQNVETSFIIGKEEELLYEYLVKEINPSDTDIQITAINYNEEIYI